MHKLVASLIALSHVLFLVSTEGLELGKSRFGSLVGKTKFMS